MSYGGATYGILEGNDNDDLWDDAYTSAKVKIQVSDHLDGGDTYLDGDSLSPSEEIILMAAAAGKEEEGEGGGEPAVAGLIINKSGSNFHSSL